MERLMAGTRNAGLYVAPDIAFAMMPITTMKMVHMAGPSANLACTILA